MAPGPVQELGEALKLARAGLRRWRLGMFEILGHRHAVGSAGEQDLVIGGHGRFLVWDFAGRVGRGGGMGQPDDGSFTGCLGLRPDPGCCARCDTPICNTRDTPLKYL